MHERSFQRGDKMVDLSTYRQGDLVRITPDLIPSEEGGDYRMFVNHSMGRHAGIESRIIAIEKSGHVGLFCILECDSGRYYWTEDMLEPVEQVSLMNLLNEC